MTAIRKALTKEEEKPEGEEVEEKAESVKSEHADDDIPDLFSLRRSPYY